MPVPLPLNTPITADNDYDYVIQDELTDIIIVGDNTGSFNGFDGAAVDIKAVHPELETSTAPFAAPVNGGANITQDFTDAYDGQVGRKLRFTVSGSGANTAIRIHAGPSDSG
jgi:hypothetical protein